MTECSGFLAATGIRVGPFGNGRVSKGIEILFDIDSIITVAVQRMSKKIEDLYKKIIIYTQKTCY